MSTASNLPLLIAVLTTLPLEHQAHCVHDFEVILKCHYKNNGALSVSRLAVMSLTKFTAVTTASQPVSPNRERRLIIKKQKNAQI